MTATTWALVAAGLVLGLVGFSFASTKSVHTERIIPASPEAIWAVLVDTDKYPEWNPVLVEAPGTMKVGASIPYQLREPNGRQYALTATVARVEPGVALEQKGGIPGVLTFHHQYRLEAVDGGTRVVQHEDYRGIGVWAWDHTWVQPAYARVNDALAERVSALASGS